MRKVIIFYFLTLFVVGIYANNYLMGQENIDYKISLMEEEEEHGSHANLFHLEDCLSTENFFEGYIIPSFNRSKNTFSYCQIFYEDVCLSCIETPPDSLI